MCDVLPNNIIQNYDIIELDFLLLDLIYGVIVTTAGLVLSAKLTSAASISLSIDNPLKTSLANTLPGTVRTNKKQ